MSQQKSEILMKAIGKWISELESYPGWKEWNHEKIGYTLYHDDEFDKTTMSKNAFIFNKKTEKQHELCMSFVHLQDTQISLRNCEFYFRRFPFYNLPVKKYEHIKNSCELYFSKFYQIRDRIKICLNKMKNFSDEEIEIKTFIKKFDKEFKDELRERNDIHHHFSFSDVTLDRLFMFESILENQKQDKDDYRSKIMEENFKTSYRKIQKFWVNDVRKKSKRTELYCDAVADAILSHCNFLSKMTPTT